MDAPHFQPAEDWLGMPVEKIVLTEYGAIVHYELLYGPVRLGCPASSSPREETSAEALAAFDSMAESHRAAARQRVELKAELSDAERCVETVGSGVDVRRCSHRAKPDTQYCGRHQARRSSSDDFTEAPNLPDTEDSFAW